MKLLTLLLACTGLHAQSWQPSAGHSQVLLWPGVPPDARRADGPETFGVTDDKGLVAGKPWTYIEDVTRPTLTVYAPAAKNTGAAVVVFPGGGYRVLAIDLEGTEVCDWLTSRGITCILLKYRVPDSGPAWHDDCHCNIHPVAPTALEDAQRAVGLVRLHAAAWGIDPHKIGVMGFSAGGHMVAALSVHFDKRLYAPVDAADRVSCRPDFAVAVYPGHLSVKQDTIELNPDIRTHITAQTPPTFLLQNEDDGSDRVEDAVSYYMALKKAGVRVEMHLYAQGGHAFGLRRTKFPATAWPALVETWLRGLGVTPE